MKPHLSKLLSLSLSLELLLAPIAPAFAETTKRKNTGAGISDVLDKTLQVGQQTGILRGTPGITGMAQGQGPYDADFQMFGGQKSAEDDSEVFNSQILFDYLPGLKDFMGSHKGSLDCKVLKPYNVVEPDVCDPSGGGIYFNPNDPNSSAPYINQANIFKKNFKDIKLFYNDSTTEYYGAKSCMSKASNILENFFKHREAELDKLSNDLNRMHAEFMKGSEDERAQIATQTALLDGSDPKLTADVDAKLLENSMKDMKKDFDASACPTIRGFKSDKLAAKGLKKSYEEVETLLTEKVGTNGFSGATYTTDHNNVVQDITNMSNIMVTQFKDQFKGDPQTGTVNGFMGKFLGGLNVPSKTGSSALMNAGNFSSLINSFNSDKDLIRMTTQQQEIVAALGNSEVTKLVADQNAIGFDKKLETYSNALQQNCLDNVLKDPKFSLAFVKSKSYTPGKSSFANKNSSNTFDSTLANILNDRTTSPEQKMEKLKAAKSTERRVVRLNSWFKTEALNKDGSKTEKIVAKGNMTATDMYADVIQHCSAQFKSNKIGSSLTGQQAIDTIKKLRQDYKKLAEKQAAAIKDEVKKKFITCESSKIANSSDVESCSPDKFDTTKSGFCANGALSCSNNMQSCTKKTQAKVEQIEKARTERVTNYNGQVKRHVAGLKALYDKTQKVFEEQAKVMAKGFPGISVASFSLPGGIDVDPKLGKIASFASHNVMLEDPEKAIGAFKNNVALLKNEVKKFQGEILAGFKNYMETKKAMYADVAAQATQMEEKCAAAVAAAGQRKNEMDKQTNEMLSKFGQQLRRFCSEYSRFSKDHPNGACVQSYSEIVEAGLEAAMKLGNSNASDAILEYQAICDGFNNEKSASSNDDSLTERQKCEQIKDVPGVSLAMVDVCNKYEAAYNKCGDSETKDETVKTVNCDKYTIDINRHYTQLVKQNKIKQEESQTLKITSSEPVYCESTDNGYRYNDKYFRPGGLGQQQGPNLAIGM